MYRLKVKGWRKIYNANIKQKKDRVPILVLEQIPSKENYQR